MDVRKMYLYGRHIDRYYCISKCNTRVCVSSGVYNNYIEFSLCLLNPANKFAFEVGLSKFNFRTKLNGAFPHFCLNVRQGRATIHLYLTLSQQIQVWSVKKKHLHSLIAKLARHGRFVESIR